MKLLAVALKDTMVTIRDREALLILLAMPFIIITILGLALGDSFGGDPGLEKYDIGVIDKDKGEISELFVEDTLKSDELAKLITVKKMSTARATKLIQRGELAAAVVIPNGFTANVKTGDGGELQILGDPGQALRSSILQGITRSFARRLSAVTIGVKAPLGVLIESEAIAPGDVDQTANLLTKEAQIAVSKPTITVGNEKTAAKIGLSAIQYY
ncbi:MAG: ABC transporter permease, partial [Actinomycetia bacterium]|nr:ABC transporter permease [Actinomycetes bacterium]